MGRVSYSQFSQWDKCPYTWKLNYVDKAETFKGNIYTLFGSAIHETLQAYLVCYYERTIKEADALPLDDILKYRMEENFKVSKKQHGDEFEVTLKRIRKRGHAIALEPANPKYETRIFGPNQVKVQGKLVGLLRKY